MILLVDDDAIQNFLSSKIIENVWPDVSLEVRNNGQEGLDALYMEGLRPQLILLDLNMPVKSGWDFIEEYMQHDEPKMPIYILTSSIHHQDRERADLYECVQGFLLKPLNMEVIRNILSKHGLIQTLP